MSCYGKKVLCNGSVELYALVFASLSVIFEGRK